MNDGTDIINSTITTRLREVRERIAEAERRYGRAPGSVSLLAVSKLQSPALIAAAFAAGQRDFGESYLQECLPKQAALNAAEICWHYTGTLQSNKTLSVAQHFDWVHSLDRMKIAERLSAQRPGRLPPLNVCIQVNIGNEPQKAGVALVELPSLARAVATLPRLQLRGLMCLPPATDEVTAQRRHFRALREAYDDLCGQGLALDTLSMGMSQDLEAAIAEGATWVRVGTAVFGPRPVAG